MTRKEILDMFKVLEKGLKKYGENMGQTGKKSESISSQIANIRKEYEKESQEQPLKWAKAIPIGKKPQSSI